MDLIQLFYFQTAARLGNFTQAAAELHITQPALSKMISNLESDLQVKLFDREGKRIRLNAHGQVVLRHAQELFGQLDTMRSELADLDGTISGPVHIGLSIPTRDRDPFLSVLRGFLDDNPDIQVTYRQTKTKDLIQGLRDKTIDVAITSSDIGSGDIVWKQLFRERLGIILSRSHPLAQRMEVSVGDLEHEVFFVNNATNDIQDLTYSFCAQAGFKPKVRFEGHFPLYIGEAISRGEGVSFIPENQFRRQYIRDMEMAIHPWAENITFRRLTDPFCVRECGYALLKGRYHSRAVQDFCHRVDQTFLSPGRDTL